MNRGPDKQNLWAENVTIFLSIRLNICFNAQKNHIVETVILNIHNT